MVLVGGAVEANTTISVGWPGSTSPATPTLNGTLFPGLLITSTTVAADTNAFGTWTVQLDASAVSQPFTDLMLVVRYTEG